MIKRVRNKICRILYNRLRYIKFPFKSNRLLIVRLDAIGDYVLFRNYIYTIKDSEKYKNYSFHFLGNVAFKELATYFEKDVIDRFYFINPKDFYTVLTWNFYERLKIILSFKIKRFDVLVNPVHSRVEYFDFFINELGAKKKIGSLGDDANFSSKEQYQRCNHLYNELIETSDHGIFEFIRNRIFVQNLIGKEVFTRLEFKKEPNSAINGTLSPNMIIIVPGAGAKWRMWDTRNFAKLIELIDGDSGSVFDYIIVGSKSESYLAEEIIKYSGYKKNILNYGGKSSLVDLVYLIWNARVVIANETSAVHIAAAVGTPVVCISNGNHFGRFNPYPVPVSQSVDTIYPEEIFYDPSMKDELIEMTKKQSHFDINKILPESVYSVIIQKTKA